MRKQQDKPTNRIDKLNSLIQKIVGEVLLSYLDASDGIVTVSKVEVSKDTRWAKVWVSIVAGDDNKVMRKIKANIYDIQGEVNRTVNLKLIPRLQFFLDVSPRYAQHISDLLNEIHSEEEPKNDE
jgi:ribosome-binding factor A